MAADAAMEQQARNAATPGGGYTLLVVDAHCALCSWGARLVARRDARDRFRILPAQTEHGRRLLAENGLDPEDPESWLVREPDGTVLVESEAAISVGRRLTGVWSWAAFLAGLLPRGLRDRLYRLVAKRRYRLFGRADLCATPSPELRRRLVQSVEEMAEPAPAPAPHLFEAAMGPEIWRTLPPEVRRLHEFSGVERFSGEAEVERGVGLASRIVAAIMGFPRAAPCAPVLVEKRRRGDGEIWTRRIGEATFRSVLTPGAPGRVRERFGLLSADIAFRLEGRRLVWQVPATRLFGAPLPQALLPRGAFHESVDEEGRFRFHVDIRAPWGDRIVRYRGWLRPVSADPAPSFEGGGEGD